MEIVVFVTFIAIQYAAKTLPHWIAQQSNGRFAVLVQRLSDRHFLVWVAHPAVLSGLHDYVIHFVVYSGYIIHH